MTRRQTRHSAALVTVAALGALAGASAPAQAAVPVNIWGPTSGYWGGTEITVGEGSAWCTTGFAIQNAGGKFMVTAGHCANEGPRVRQVNANGATGGTIGTLVGINNGFGNDFAAYANGGVRGFQNAGGYQQKVTGWVSPAGAAGGRACYNGSTTGYTCGTIAGVFGDRFCLAGAPNAAEGGDSGSAVYTEPANGEVRIIGIINTADSCGTGVNRILDAYGATLVTECSL